MYEILTMKKEKKIIEIKKRLTYIKKKYGSLELLKKKFNSCRKSTNEGKKEVVADMRKVYRLKQEISSIEKEIGVENDEDLSKYKDNCEKVKAIIDKYQSLTGLRDKYNMYQSSKKRKHKEANNDMKSYERNMKKSETMRRRKK